jgi:hypothetical protein
MRAGAARQAGGADNDDALFLRHIRARPVSLTRAEENVTRSRASNSRHVPLSGTGKSVAIVEAVLRKDGCTCETPVSGAGASLSCGSVDVERGGHLQWSERSGRSRLGSLRQRAL